ncbi:heme ABC exporter ATP-binding protein CcmA [Altererythrobacter salegens]|uniref:Heme ABC exporter ATP-binding protein CcmA n=1 Tax=Croceibacterium salegens TaxID=1737568 RepID=A0A6I4SQF8_9SPHN|nr:heme ABC exporter ATP-binding protein CcmA [Croceibacterium salegens]MXO58045.1 heme ABC exporter ATP-binding protein CcmA [Croceibacterium salegens]
MEGAHLKVSDLACRRGDRVLFRGLSFDLAPGGALQVRGANGTGKSSLLRIVAGLLRPFAGKVEFAGSVSLLDGNLPLDEHLPLGKALAFWARIDGANEALDAPGLNVLSDVPVRYLSTGQRKRAAIVQSAPKPGGLWLLDEPLNGLDAAAAKWLVGRVSEHCAGGGLALIASHQPFGLGDLTPLDIVDYAP